MADVNVELVTSALEIPDEETEEIGEGQWQALLESVAGVQSAQVAQMEMLRTLVELCQQLTSRVPDSLVTMLQSQQEMISRQNSQLLESLTIRQNIPIQEVLPVAVPAIPVAELVAPAAVVAPVEAVPAEQPTPSVPDRSKRRRL